MYVIRTGVSSSYEGEVGVGKWRVKWVIEENFEILEEENGGRETSQEK